jgi:flagellar hook assembly protein FlgD
VPRAEPVSLVIYDVQGRAVRTLASGTQSAGWHPLEWRGENDGGAPVGAGIFFAVFKAEGRTITQRLVRLQ